MCSKSFEDVLKDCVGKVITVINPSTYIPTLTGYKIDATSYKAKVISCEDGILRILIDYLSDPRQSKKEKAYQFVPTDQIKRIMVSKSERFVTI